MLWWHWLCVAVGCALVVVLLAWTMYARLPKDMCDPTACRLLELYQRLAVVRPVGFQLPHVKFSICRHSSSAACSA